VALLGAGHIASFHIRALATLGIPVVAICDIDGEKASRLAQTYSIPEQYDSMETLLERSRCKTVHVVLPPAAHAAAVIACLNAGRNVFVEKPFTVSMSEGKRVASAAAASGGIVGVNHNHCFYPESLKLDEYIRSWRLGGPEHVVTWFNVPLRQLNAGQHQHWMFRQPLNILLEQAVHPLSHIVHLLGPVCKAEVLCTNEMRLNTGAPFLASWHCGLECERGTALLLMSFGKTNLDLQSHVIGEDGSCSLDFARGVCGLTQKTRFVKPMDDLIANWQNGKSMISQGIGNFSNYALAFLKLRPQRDSFGSSILESIRGFYADLASGRPPRQGIREGLAVIEACEMVEQSRQRVAERHGEAIHG
jgi:predicted dehydrogenase